MRLAAQQARTGRLVKHRRVVQGKDWIYIYVYTHTHMLIYGYIQILYIRLYRRLYHPAQSVKTELKWMSYLLFGNIASNLIFLRPLVNFQDRVFRGTCSAGQNVAASTCHTVLKTCLSNAPDSGHVEVACIAAYEELFCCLCQMFCFGILTVLKKCPLKCWATELPESSAAAVHDIQH